MTMEKRFYVSNPEGLLTPDLVETSIGDLDFFDGVPSTETADKVYDYLDRMRGVDAFMKGMPAASHYALVEGPRSIGVDATNKVLIFENFMDSMPLFLTGNTSTVYAMPYLNLQGCGPMVLEVPKGALGALNDAWFRYILDFQVAEEDEVQKYLIIPPGVPLPKMKVDSDEYIVVESPSVRLWAFIRFKILADDTLEEVVANAKAGLKVYPFGGDPVEMEFINGSGKSFNTIHHNDFSFYKELNNVIQLEPYDLIDKEMRGLFASIGIEKGKTFAPDLRMTRILTDAVAIGNAASRSIVWYPRFSGSVDNMEGIRFYPETNSAWIPAFLKKDVYFDGDDNYTMNTDARVMFHYPYTAVTPNMAVYNQGQGSDYAMAYLDADKAPMDGSKMYKLNIPGSVPVGDDGFWAVTIYDTQTRSQLQTSQPLPTVSESTGVTANADESFDVFFGPVPPAGKRSNWLQTIPGKSWFIIFRIYSPMDEWDQKTWFPGEVERVDFPIDQSGNTATTLPASSGKKGK